MTKHYFRTLAGLRGIAALFVVIDHGQSFFSPLTAPMSYLAVDLFFLISGVVIEASYGERLREGLSIGQFLRIRAIRLYPLYLLGMGLMAGCVCFAKGGSGELNALFGLGLPANLALWLPGLAFLPLLNGPNMFPLDPCAWSLFFELVINLVFACIARHLTTRLALVTSLVSLLLLIPDMLVRDQNLFISGMLRAGFSFFLGVAMYRRYLMNPRVIAAPWAWAAILGAGLALSLHVPAAAMPGAALAIIGMAFPALVWLAMRTAPGNKTAQIFSRAGDASYAIYVLHEPFIVLLTLIITDRLHHRVVKSPPFAGLTIIVALIILASCLDRFYDSPVRRFLSRNTRPALQTTEIPESAA
jgi:peptidoglycan/LPS O-acetylase OafA/YrhL